MSKIIGNVKKNSSLEENGLSHDQKSVSWDNLGKNILKKLKTSIKTGQE